MEASIKKVATVDCRVFDKLPMDPAGLIMKLRRQGMLVNAESALPYLLQVGAYRMKGYWYQWQDRETKNFKSNVCFDEAIRRYEFDRELRRITAVALERIEIMVRVVFSEVMAEYEGPHWFMKDEVFVSSGTANKAARRSFVQKIEEEISRMRDKAFIAHYFQKYDYPRLPPSWVICECLSFGAWSYGYKDLANQRYRKLISRRFKVEDDHVFASWLHAFSVLRNVVAHHGRLMGGQSSVTPKSYQKRGLYFGRSRNFFVLASVINYVSASIRQGPGWRANLESLFERYPGLDVDALLGFPPDWLMHPVWRESA